MIDRVLRLSDRINPIVVKEARQAVNSRLVSGTLLLFLAIQLTVMLVMLATRDARLGPTDDDLRAGRTVFTIIQGILLGTCMLLIPALTAARLAAERSDVNVDLFFITTLSPRAIMAGKLLTAAATALLIFSACAPFMTFAYVLRGLDMPTILLVLATDFLAVITGTMFALLLAAIPASRGMRILLGLGGLIALCYLFGGVLTMTAAFLEFEFRFDTTSGDFWLGFAGAAAGVLGITGLMFVWATALITPPTANRALPVRLYTFALWAVAAVVCAVWSNYIRSPGPIFVWGMIGTIIFAHSMLIAVSERDGLGARVQRRIPRSIFLRVPAFLLYSGAAGGIAFAAIGGALSALGMLAWHELSPSTSWPSDWWEPAQVAGLVTGYTYCYCMIAVIVRRLLRSTPFPPTVTWLAALILFALGCILPFIAAYAFFPEQRRYAAYQDEMIPLYLPNPFIMIDVSMEEDRHAVLTTTFLILWGAMATIANGPWLLRQIVSFRPPERVEKAAEEGKPAAEGQPAVAGPQP